MDELWDETIKDTHNQLKYLDHEVMCFSSPAFNVNFHKSKTSHEIKLVYYARTLDKRLKEDIDSYKEFLESAFNAHNALRHQILWKEGTLNDAAEKKKKIKASKRPKKMWEGMFE